MAVRILVTLFTLLHFLHVDEAQLCSTGFAMVSKPLKPTFQVEKKIRHNLGATTEALCRQECLDVTECAGVVFFSVSGDCQLFRVGHLIEGSSPDFTTSFVKRCRDDLPPETSTVNGSQAHTGDRDTETARDPDTGPLSHEEILYIVAGVVSFVVLLAVVLGVFFCIRAGRKRKDKLRKAPPQVRLSLQRVPPDQDGQSDVQSDGQSGASDASPSYSGVEGLSQAEYSQYPVSPAGGGGRRSSYYGGQHYY